MSHIAWALSQISEYCGHVAPWLRALVLAVLFMGLVRSGFKPGYAFCLLAVFLAIAFGQGVETFANALNQGATGVPTVRLLLALAALGWLGQVLREGKAVDLLADGLRRRVEDPRGRGILLSMAVGLLPGAQGAGASSACTRGIPMDDAHRAALHLWFQRLGSLTLPVGAGLLVACDLGKVSLPRAASLLLPLALAMAAVGLVTLARDLPCPAGADAPAPLAQDGLWRALLPAGVALALAFTLPSLGIPEVRATQPARRILESLLGLLAPVTLGAALGALLAARNLGLSSLESLKALRVACHTDLVVFVVGLKVFEQIALAKLTFSGSPGSDVGEALARLGGAGVSLTCLALPALAGFFLGGSAAALGLLLPFLLPAMGTDALLVSLAYTGAFLGKTFSKSALAGALPGEAFRASLREVRWRLALPAALLALVAALLTLAP
jgi:hypothetical protein